ncbi:GNAT family N-acetyltransferase [Streptomyces sp. SID5785]|uniref:GNAT family N-acetyltransferase n=1 Tax=Streptomyces sp. SID5785 TaxID=2690309 RepID=UPI0013618C82|nr:GNAT family N-acetyltransferase [Streptomyces sp. SID5785]MZD07984.1 GNAT family N-acetyltransferase [Streptomyces sp. SID5785]
MRIERPASVRQIVAAAGLFDAPPRREWAQEFLSAQGHHLFFAYEEEAGPEPVGFISGVETVHPDKGREMFLYELGVAGPYRRRGVARALIRALAGLAREHGCYGMWVGVDPENEPALAAYRSAGGVVDGPCTVVDWDLSDDTDDTDDAPAADPADGTR